MNAFTNTFVLEIANNHLGSPVRALRLLRECAKIAKEFPDLRIAAKLQARGLDYVHPDHRGSHSSSEYARKVSERQLTFGEIDNVVRAVRQESQMPIGITAFDEESCDFARQANFDFLKIASSSFWENRLLRKAFSMNMPVSLSVAGDAALMVNDVLQDVRPLANVNDLCINHCVSMYPTPLHKCNLWKLRFLEGMAKRNHKTIVGYSSHTEYWAMRDSHAMALAMGAESFERHFALAEDKLPGYNLNQYQIRGWLDAHMNARAAIEQSHPLELEYVAKHLRGAYAKEPIRVGESLKGRVYYAIPYQGPGHFGADFDEGLTAWKDFDADAPII